MVLFGLEKYSSIVPLLFQHPFLYLVFVCFIVVPVEIKEEIGCEEKMRC